MPMPTMNTVNNLRNKMKNAPITYNGFAITNRTATHKHIKAFVSQMQN